MTRWDPRSALTGLGAVLALSAMICSAPPVSAQRSVGRGWSMASEADWVGAGVPFYNIDAATAKDGAAPEGITPLARDIFTSDDFYVDRELWRDPRYFRCNSTLGLDSQWGDYSSAPTYIKDDPGDGRLGPLRCGLLPRAHREPLRVRDGSSALRGAARGNPCQRRPDAVQP